MFRWTLLAVLLLLTARARAERILLVPLDSRPAAGQFAQMIGRIADEDVRMPPFSALGRFINPGKPDEILQWLSSQSGEEPQTLIVSADMICYGGLIASREGTTTLELARLRLKKLIEIRRRSPKTKLFVFSSTMRLAPTATQAAASWRMRLARYEELKDRVERLGLAKDRTEMEATLASLPPGVVDRYEQTRARDHAIQMDLIKATSQGKIDYLVIGQDDARPYGPHVPETERLRAAVQERKAEKRIYFCEGIDQHASVLISRALLARSSWVPKVRVAYSDPLGAKKYANYESKPIEKSLEDQILASGAAVAEPGGQYDYTLYLNTPQRRESTFREWLDDLKTEVDQGLPVAVADINFDETATADPLLFEALWQDSRIMSLLAYAGWNTAGNTMGTAIPTANLTILARQQKVDPLKRELAAKEFLLHRLVDDYAFHRFTRPQAYGMLLSTNRDEIYGMDYADTNDFIQRDLQKRLEEYFSKQFAGRRFYVGTAKYELIGLKDVKIGLPWPRCYEVRLQFRIEAAAVTPERWQVSSE